MSNSENRQWQVSFNKGAARGRKKLPKKVDERLALLVAEIERAGPFRKNWKNYSPIPQVWKNAYHCHLKDGRPTYVACWTIYRDLKEVEFFYVGTRENTFY